MELTDIVGYKRITDDIAVVELASNKSVLYECQSEDILFRDFQTDRVTYTEIGSRKVPHIDVSRELSATSIYTKQEGRFTKEATRVFNMEEVACRRYLQEIATEIDTQAQEILSGMYEIREFRPHNLRTLKELTMMSLFSPLGALALIPALAYALIDGRHGSGYPFMGAILYATAPFVLVKECIYPQKVQEIDFKDLSADGIDVSKVKPAPVAYAQFKNITFQISPDRVARVDGPIGEAQYAGKIAVDKKKQQHLEELVEIEKRFSQEHQEYFASLSTEDHEQILLKVI